MREQVDALRSILQSLTGKQQEVWKLRVQRHRSFAEIADQLGYASADVARQSFNDVKASVLVGLRRRGFTATRTRD